MTNGQTAKTKRVDPKLWLPVRDAYKSTKNAVNQKVGPFETAWRAIHLFESITVCLGSAYYMFLKKHAADEDSAIGIACKDWFKSCVGGMRDAAKMGSIGEWQRGILETAIIGKPEDAASALREERDKQSEDRRAILKDAPFLYELHCFLSARLDTDDALHNEVNKLIAAIDYPLQLNADLDYMRNIQGEGALLGHARIFELLRLFNSAIRNKIAHVPIPRDAIENIAPQMQRVAEAVVDFGVFGTLEPAPMRDGGLPKSNTFGKGCLCGEVKEINGDVQFRFKSSDGSDAQSWSAEPLIHLCSGGDHAYVFTSSRGDTVSYHRYNAESMPIKRMEVPGLWTELSGGVDVGDIEEMTIAFSDLEGAREEGSGTTKLDNEIGRAQEEAGETAAPSQKSDSNDEQQVDEEKPARPQSTDAAKLGEGVEGTTADGAKPDGAKANRPRGEVELKPRTRARKRRLGHNDGLADERGCWQKAMSESDYSMAWNIAKSALKKNPDSPWAMTVNASHIREEAVRSFDTSDKADPSHRAFNAKIDKAIEYLEAANHIEGIHKGASAYELSKVYWHDAMRRTDEDSRRDAEDAATTYAEEAVTFEEQRLSDIYDNRSDNEEGYIQVLEKTVERLRSWLSHCKSTRAYR
ncbi:MAG: hypothetical protein HOJ54_10100 [Phycisphaerae bacterium]|jgi:hypothetical protein|nr:hypothetical protein [Phycisphaerae bacterium]